MDITVTYPAAGKIHFHSKFLFADPQNELCQEFVRRVIDTTGVLGITIKSARSHSGRKTRRRTPVAEVQYCVRSRTRRQAVEEIYTQLLGGSNGNFFYSTSPTDRAQSANGRESAAQHSSHPSHGRAPRRPL